MDTITLPVYGPLDLAATLTSGQAFRWRPWDKGWAGIVDKSLWIIQHDLVRNQLRVQSDRSTFRGLSLREGVIQYLGLQDSLHTIQQSILKRLKERGYAPLIPKMQQIFDYSPGLRILRQDPFEMLISFLLSVQSTIANVQRRIEQIAALFPENYRRLLDFQGYLFPDFGQMSTLDEQTLRRERLGFRTQWLFEMIRSLRNDEMATMQATSFHRKMERLMSMKGVGCKVASCTVLYGYGDLRAFPVDVWMGRALQDLFGWNDLPHLLMEKGMDLFGDVAGYAQLYIFRYYRERYGKGGNG